MERHAAGRSSLKKEEWMEQSESPSISPQVRKSAEESLPEKPPSQKTKRPAAQKSRLRSLMFALLPVALVIGMYCYVTGGATMSTENAYVQADKVGLSTDVGGIVSEILVHDNQTVVKGAILFKLDPQQFQFALDRAEA